VADKTKIKAIMGLGSFFAVIVGWQALVLLMASLDKKRTFSKIPGGFVFSLSAIKVMIV